VISPITHLFAISSSCVLLMCLFFTSHCDVERHLIMTIFRQPVPLDQNKTLSLFGTTNSLCLSLSFVVKYSAKMCSSLSQPLSMSEVIRSNWNAMSQCVPVCPRWDAMAFFLCNCVVVFSFELLNCDQMMVVGRHLWKGTHITLFYERHTLHSS